MSLIVLLLDNALIPAPFKNGKVEKAKENPKLLTATCLAFSNIGLPSIAFSTALVASSPESSKALSYIRLLFQLSFQ